MMSPWLIEIGESPGATRSVVCLAPAGAGAGRFAVLRKHLDPDIRVLGVQLPGREQRWGEQPVTSMPVAVAEIMAVLPAELTAPYVIYGHSMGGLLGYELARALSVGHRQPTALVLAAIRPPHLVSRAEAREAAGDVRLRATIDAELAGTAFAGDDDFAELLLTTLRADVRLCAEYRHVDEPVLTCPVVAWAGQEDRAVTRDHMSQWRRYTRAPFRIAEMPGGHHFARTHADHTALALQDPAIWGVAPPADSADRQRGNC